MDNIIISTIRNQMLNKINNQNKIFIFAFLLSFISIIGVYSDIKFEYRWIYFWLWIISVCMIIWAALSKKIQSMRFDYYLFLIILIALITRLIFINVYPFVTIGDMLRDGGLNAYDIYMGNIKNIFAYGSYEAHGLIIPTFTSLLIPIFRNSAMIFKLSAAFVGIADVVAVYLITKRYINEKAGIISAFVLISLPVHLYYSRTEVVVIFSSFLTTLIIGAFLNYYYKKTISNIVLLGTVLGFALNFHASVKTVVFLTIIIIFVLLFYESLIRKSFKLFIQRSLLFIIFIIVGFGPRLLFTPFEVLFHLSRISTSNSILEMIYSFSQTAQSEYLKSFMVYVYENAGSHSSLNEPLLNPVFAIFFVIGLIQTFFSKKTNLKILSVFCFVLPFTNSAITDMINSDHRLGPLLPIASFYIGFGFYSMVKTKDKFKKLKSGLLVSVLILAGLGNIFTFFNSNVANETNYGESNYRRYTATYIAYFLKDYDVQNICIYGEEDMIKYLELMHMREMLSFYNSGKNISYMSDFLVQDDIYISENCDITNIKDFTKYTFCDDVVDEYICPKDDLSDIEFYSNLK